MRRRFLAHRARLLSTASPRASDPARRKAAAAAAAAAAPPAPAPAPRVQPEDLRHTASLDQRDALLALWEQDSARHASSYTPLLAEPDFDLLPSSDRDTAKKGAVLADATSLSPSELAQQFGRSEAEAHDEPLAQFDERIAEAHDLKSHHHHHHHHQHRRRRHQPRHQDLISPSSAAAAHVPHDVAERFGARAQQMAARAAVEDGEDDDEDEDEL